MEKKNPASRKPEVAHSRIIQQSRFVIGRLRVRHALRFTDSDGLTEAAIIEIECLSMYAWRFMSDEQLALNPEFAEGADIGTSRCFFRDAIPHPSLLRRLNDLIDDNRDNYEAEKCEESQRGAGVDAPRGRDDGGGMK